MSGAGRPVRPGASEPGRMPLTRRTGPAAAWHLGLDGNTIAMAMGLAAGHGPLLPDQPYRRVGCGQATGSDFGGGRRTGPTAAVAFGCRTSSADRATCAGPAGSGRTFLARRIGPYPACLPEVRGGTMGMAHNPAADRGMHLPGPLHRRIRPTRVAGNDPGDGHGRGRTGAAPVGCRTSGADRPIWAWPNHSGRANQSSRDPVHRCHWNGDRLGSRPRTIFPNRPDRCVVPVQGTGSGRGGSRPPGRTGAAVIVCRMSGMDRPPVVRAEPVGPGRTAPADRIRRPRPGPSGFEAAPSGTAKG